MSDSFGLHRLGWSSFQQLCLTIAREVLGQTTRGFLDSNDAGRDGAYTGRWTAADGETLSGRFVLQCKFTSTPGARLTLGGFQGELPKVRTLVARGRCDVYVLLTNLGISASQEAAIVEALETAGVKHTRILGSTWIEGIVRENTRLRMMVPRLYGLGDLSQIIDARAYAQARAVLESMSEDLAKVVVTETYVRAARALDAGGFVMLIGEPAAGKTTIASMLAMAAADRWKASVLKLSNPSTVVDRWNPDEPCQFFWIDDAFGVTQYESSLVTGWNHSLMQVKTMLAKGAKIVMTSRDYIYNRAREDLKLGAFPMLREREVVIDVHALSRAEKEQILYNHLKLGSQSTEFLEQIKPFLESVAAHPRFIPEIARRLSSPVFTKDLTVSSYHLDEFVERREQLLGEVIQNLDRDSQAALALIYMRADHLESPVRLNKPEEDAIRRLDSNLGRCVAGLEALDGSMVAFVHVDGQSVWRFKHPTIGDAYAARLATKPDLLDIFIAGSSTENLLTQVTCGDVGIERAVVVPRSFFPQMIRRLTAFKETNRFKERWSASYFARRDVDRFLSTRCSKEFLVRYLEAVPATADRVCRPTPSLTFSPDVGLAIRLHEYGLLPETNRRIFVGAVGDCARDGSDPFALENPGARSLFTDGEYGALLSDVRRDLVPRLDKVRSHAENRHDSTDRADEHMQDTVEMFDALKNVFADDADVQRLVAEQHRKIKEWIDDHQAEDEKVPTRKLGAVDSTKKRGGTRSIFDDIAD